MTTHAASGPSIVPLCDEVRTLVPDLVATRRKIHSWPELGMQEHQTARLVAHALAPLGIEVRQGVAGTGVVGIIRGRHPGRTVLLRADMDALPVGEETGVPFASERPGLMHACGHDGHVAILLSVARVLAARRGELAGTVVLCFQPAEEGPGGALPMIEAGVLDEPRVDAAFGLHLWNDLPAGTVGVRAGTLMAAVDQITLRLKGRGGHASAPHQTVDPVHVAAHVVTGLYSLRSREVDPQSPFVVSITAMQAGQAFNVVPDEATLRGTVRTFDAALRGDARARIERLVGGIAAAFGADSELDYRHGYPATVNDAAMADLVRRAAARVVGAGSVVEARPTMGGEDMAYFLERVPGCYFFVGASNPARGIGSPHHSTRFDIDEASLPIGVEVFLRIVEEFLGH